MHAGSGHDSIAVSGPLTARRTGGLLKASLPPPPSSTFYVAGGAALRHGEFLRSNEHTDLGVVMATAEEPRQPAAGTARRCRCGALQDTVAVSRLRPYQP
eukprot:scaffold7474_cov113-Isochrysis_galbana.AAC.8